MNGRQPAATPHWPWPAALAPFRPASLELLRGYRRSDFGRDLAAGVTVGVVALPLAMAFAIASGLPPQAGIVTAVIAGFIIAALGGSAVQIGGPAGAFIVIVYGIVQRYGLGNLLIATVLAGMLLLAMGLLRLGALVRYIPVSIVLGFTNGIAVLIALSQVKDMLGLRIERMPADFFGQLHAIGAAIGSIDAASVVMACGCLALILLWQRWAVRLPGSWPAGAGSGRIRSGLATVPGTIVALVLATTATALLHLPVETIGSRFGGIPGGLPGIVVPDISWDAARGLVIPTLTIAILGAIESLLCARVADNMLAQRADPPPRHDPNQELMALGIANMVVPFFGGLPATGTIARTVTNIRSGARTPVAGMVHALTLLIILLAAAPLALHVPMPALAAILMFVAYNMGEWREFGHLRRAMGTYRILFLGTFTLTVVVDLTVAVEVGLVLACAFFIHRISTLTRVEALPAGQEDRARGIETRALVGALFFGAVDKIEALRALAAQARVRVVLLDAHRLISLDMSGLEAMRQLRQDLARQGKSLVICGLEDQPAELVRRSGWAAELGADGLVSDFATGLAVARRLAGPPIGSSEAAAGRGESAAEADLRRSDGDRKEILPRAGSGDVAQ
jgi:SulP family sulfate permease